MAVWICRASSMTETGILPLHETRATCQRLLAVDDLLDVIDIAAQRIEFGNNIPLFRRQMRRKRGEIFGDQLALFIFGKELTDVIAMRTEQLHDAIRFFTFEFRICLSTSAADTFTLFSTLPTLCMMPIANVPPCLCCARP